MSEPYIGEIRMVGFNFAPVGWAFCDGSLLQISQNDALFNLIGTTYGGDGQNTFGLPNLQGRIPVHQGIDSFGNPYVIGQLSGSENVTLTLNQIPSHTHSLLGQTTAGTHPSPANGVSAIEQFSGVADHLNGSGSAANRRRPAARQHAHISGDQLRNLVVRIFPSQN